MKKKHKQIEEALVTEIHRADEEGDPWLIGRCWGLAHALGLLRDTSTDEELWAVADAHGLMDMANRVFTDGRHRK